MPLKSGTCVPSPACTDTTQSETAVGLLVVQVTVQLRYVAYVLRQCCFRYSDLHEPGATRRVAHHKGMTTLLLPQHTVAVL